MEFHAGLKFQGISPLGEISWRTWLQEASGALRPTGPTVFAENSVKVGSAKNGVNTIFREFPPISPRNARPENEQFYSFSGTGVPR